MTFNYVHCCFVTSRCSSCVVLNYALSFYTLSFSTRCPSTRCLSTRCLSLRVVLLHGVLLRTVQRDRKGFSGGIFSHFVYVYLLEVLCHKADLRPRTSMKSSSRLCITTQMAEHYWSEESSLLFVSHDYRDTQHIIHIQREKFRTGPLFNFLTRGAMDRT